jgi:hypothetical protein
MGKRRVCRLPSERHFPTRMDSRQDLRGYVQKLHGGCCSWVSVLQNAKPNRKESCGSRWRACAGITHVLIWGDLYRVPMSRACPKGGAAGANPSRAGQKSAEAVVPTLEIQSRRECLSNHQGVKQRKPRALGSLRRDQSAPAVMQKSALSKLQKV